jgi:hypothetical protein
MQIELNAEEIQMLRQIVDSYVSDLRMEITATDSQPFREELKKRQRFLEKLLASLPASP